MLLIRYFDVALLVVAAPILLVIGVPALGYLVGAGAWILLRAVGVAVEQAIRGRDARAQISARLGYMLGRLFLLAAAVIVARQAGGKNDGLAALAVIVVAFTDRARHLRRHPTYTLMSNTRKVLLWHRCLLFAWADPARRRLRHRDPHEPRVPAPERVQARSTG